MRDEPRALRDEQALVREREVDAAGAHLARDALVVTVRVEAEERDAESVLAACGAVARPGVAAGAQKHRHHVALETGRGNEVCVLDDDGDGHGLSVKLNAHFGFPVSKRGDGFVFDFCELRAGQGELRLRGDVVRDAVGAGCARDEKLAFALVEKVDVGWENLELRLRRHGLGTDAACVRKKYKREQHKCVHDSKSPRKQRVILSGVFGAKNL